MVDQGKVMIGVTEDLTDRYNALDIVKKAAACLGGVGGGRTKRPRSVGGDATFSSLSGYRGYQRVASSSFVGRETFLALAPAFLTFFRLAIRLSRQKRRQEL